MKINKEKFVSFRVTKSEKTLLEKQTIEAGFRKISSYVRDRLGL